MVIPLLLIFNIFPHLKGVFLIVKEQIATLSLLGLYMLLILYVFSWFGFFFFPKMFKYEGVDKNNELVSYMEESICSSSVPCILYFMNYGLSSEGSIDMNLISFKYSVSYYLIQFFFEIFLYLFIHMIFFNVVLATIGNAFDGMKQKVDQKNYDEKNVCFICGKTRIDSINDPNDSDFDKHLRKHDKWKYIIYMINIILKNKEEYTNKEYEIWRQIKKKKLNWLPKYDKESDDKKPDDKKSDDKDDKKPETKSKGEKTVKKKIKKKKTKKGDNKSNEEDNKSNEEDNISNKGENISNEEENI